MKKALLACLVVAFAIAVPAADAGVHVAGIDTSSYPVLRLSVVTPTGSPAPAVREDGQPVVAASAVNLGAEKSVVLAVDTSESMAGTSIDDAVAAARGFVADKQPNDRLEVVAFGHQAVAVSRFSTVGEDADSALASLSTDTRSGTALWDAVVLAAHGLAAQPAGGHVLLLLTDGHDVSSLATEEDAIRAANQARVSVYAIGIAGPDFTPQPLQELASRTGGVYRQASSTAQLAGVYQALSTQLDRTWEVRYDTAARPGATIQLGVSVPGAGTASRSAVLHVPGVSSAAAPAPVLGRAFWRSSTAQVATALGFGLLLLLAAGFVGAARKGAWLSGRLAPHLGPSEQRRGRTPQRRQGSLRRLFTSTDAAFANVRQFRTLQTLLVRADLPLLGAELLYICVGCGFTLGLFVAVLAVSPVIVLACVLIGGSLPVFFVALKASARVKAFDAQLPDLLITIAASLKAGHSFRHSIQAVVDEGVEPAATEFKRVLTETQLGRPMDEALAEMGERLGSKHLSFVLTATAIQRQIGGSLAGLFDMVGETVRNRQQFARKVKGLTAMGRMSAYVLIGLPFFLALTITVMNSSYMAPLWDTSTGHFMVVTTLVMIAIGSLILKKIVSFKG